MIVTRKDFAVNNLKEFVEYVTKNQTKVNEAHAGVGSQSHTYCTLLQSKRAAVLRNGRMRGPEPRSSWFTERPRATGFWVRRMPPKRGLAMAVTGSSWE